MELEGSGRVYNSAFQGPLDKRSKTGNRPAEVGVPTTLGDHGAAAAIKCGGDPTTGEFRDLVPTPEDVEDDEEKPPESTSLLKLDGRRLSGGAF